MYLENIDDLLLAGVLGNDGQLVLLSQLCSDSDLTAFEKDFELDSYTDEKCKASFSFDKDDVRVVCLELGIPARIQAGNGTVVQGEEGLCIRLRPFSCPKRLRDLSEIFGMFIVQACIT